MCVGRQSKASSFKHVYICFRRRLSPVWRDRCGDGEVRRTLQRNMPAAGALQGHRINWKGLQGQGLGGVQLERASLGLWLCGKSYPLGSEGAPFGAVLRDHGVGALPVGGGDMVFGPPIAAMEVMVVCNKYCLLADLGVTTLTFFSLLFDCARNLHFFGCPG